MGESVCRDRRLARRRRFRRGRQGLVSVVGTLLSLLVFLALFGTFITFYLPLWMGDNEANFTNSVQASMADLQANMQLQASSGQIAVQATPFTLSSEAVPLLTVATQGVLLFLPKTPGVFASVSIANFLNPGVTYTQNLSLGTLQLSLPNRYYAGQTFELENGAVIQSQADNSQVLAFPPIFNIVKNGNKVNLTMMLTQTYGNATRVTSPGTIEVGSHLLGSLQNLQSVGSVSSLVLQIQTHFPCAWTNFFTQTRSAANLTAAQMTVTSLDNPAPCHITNGTPQMLTVTLFNLASVTLIVAYFSLVAGVGVL